MIVSTQNQLDGYQVVETLGLVQGSTIRARHIGTDILAGLRNIVGGEVHEYTKMLAESREQSLDRMIANAEEAGANAVLCMRFTTSTVMTGMAEFLAYGTAVKIEPVS
ncbi:MAG: YbjQ family protein [Candidatus Marinimicrobia bacterium]|nr:YbjQ family protein [Candidatus Neomarinimicrobiota bacterium]